MMRCNVFAARKNMKASCLHLFSFLNRQRKSEGISFKMMSRRFELSTNRKVFIQLNESRQIFLCGRNHFLQLWEIRHVTLRKSLGKFKVNSFSSNLQL